MKKQLLLLVSAFLLASPLVMSCNDNNKEPEIIQPEGDKPEPETPDVPDNPDPEQPVDPQTKVATLKEAHELCEKVGLSYKEKFDENVKVSIEGTVLCDFAISGAYHFMVFADETGILPIMITGNKDIINKYWVNNKYQVQGIVGSFRNSYCLKVEENPIRRGESNLDITKFAIESTIPAVYEAAYNLKVEEKDESIDTNLLKIRATYVEKINENLFIVFDGTNHIIVHGDNHVNNGLTFGEIYDFYVFPTVHDGKRSAEFIKAVSTKTKDTTYYEDIKKAAVSSTISEISKVDPYDDNKKVYPKIFKVNAYVKANVIDNKHHLAFVDDTSVKIKYDNLNKKPQTVYAKNHVVDDYNAKYSNLVPYYESDPAIKGEFYFIVSEYQTNYHAFQAYVIDNLTIELNTQN